MTEGTRVFQANVYSNPLTATKPYYLNEGEVSGVIEGGVQMVRFHTMLLPLTGRGGAWRACKIEAKRDAWLELVRLSGALQAQADALYAEIEHDSLTTEEAA